MKKKGVAALTLSIGQASIAQMAVDGIGAVASLFSVPYLLSALGQEPFALIGLVAVITNQLSFIGLGLPVAVQRKIASARGGGDGVLRAATVQVSAAMGLSQASAAGLIVFSFAPAVFRGSGDLTSETLASALQALPAVVLIVAAFPLLAALQASLYGDERYGFAAAWRLSHQLIRIALSVVVAWRTHSIIWVLWSFAVVDWMFAVVAAFATVGTSWQRIPRQLAITAGRDLLAIGVPLVVSSLLLTLLNDLEKMAILRVGKLADFPYYETPFRVISRIAIIANAPTGPLFSRLAALGEAGETVAAAQLTFRAVRLSAVAMMVFLAPVMALTPELLLMWLGPDNGPRFVEHATAPSQILLVSLVLGTGFYVSQIAFLARGRTLLLTPVYLLELIVHIAVVYFFVTWWGLPGAAAAWGARSVLNTLVHQGLAANLWKAPYLGFATSWIPGVGMLLLWVTFGRFNFHWTERLGVALLGSLVVALLVVSREDWSIVRRSLLHGRS